MKKDKLIGELIDKMNKIDTIPTKEQHLSEYAIKQAIFNCYMKGFEELVTEFIEAKMEKLSDLSKDPNISDQEYFDVFTDWLSYKWAW